MNVITIMRTDEAIKAKIDEYINRIEEIRDTHWVGEYSCALINRYEEYIELLDWVLDEDLEYTPG